MTNLEAAIIAKEAQVRKLLTELEALKKAQAILDGNSDTTPTTPIRRRRRRTGSTVGDKAAQVLSEAGRAMHADEILSKLRDVGFETSKPTLVSALLKDNHKRFKSLGNNNYELNAPKSEAIEEATSPHETLFGNGNGVNGNGQQQRFPLLQEVRSAITEITGDITQHAVLERLTAKHPEVKTLYPASVASALRRLTELGELEVIQESVGGAPKVYRRLTEGVMA